MGASCGCDDCVLLCRTLQSKTKIKYSNNNNKNKVKSEGLWYCGQKMVLLYQKIVTMNTCQPNTDGRDKQDESQGYTQTGTITSAVYTTYLLIFTGTVLRFFKVVLRNPSLDYVLLLYQ